MYVGAVGLSMCLYKKFEQKKLKSETISEKQIWTLDTQNNVFDNVHTYFFATKSLKGVQGSVHKRFCPNISRTVTKFNKIFE